MTTIPKQSHKIRNTSIVAIIVVVLGVVGALQLVMSNASECNQTVTVSGKFYPANKVDVWPTVVMFINTTTNEKLSVTVINGQYSIQLPNRASYQVIVSWTMAPGARTGTTEPQTLNLNANTPIYTFDMNW